MIESNTYKDSVAKGELVPQITLNTLADPNEEWSIFEVVLQMCIFSGIVCITFETICILYADVGSPGIRLIRSAVMATVGGPVHFVHFDANF